MSCYVDILSLVKLQMLLLESTSIIAYTWKHLHYHHFSWRIFWPSHCRGTYNHYIIHLFGHVRSSHITSEVLRSSYHNHVLFHRHLSGIELRDQLPRLDPFQAEELRVLSWWPVSPQFFIQGLLSFYWSSIFGSIRVIFSPYSKGTHSCSRTA